MKNIDNEAYDAIHIALRIVLIAEGLCNNSGRSVVVGSKPEPQFIVSNVRMEELHNAISVLYDKEYKTPPGYYTNLYGQLCCKLKSILGDPNLKGPGFVLNKQEISDEDYLDFLRWKESKKPKPTPEPYNYSPSYDLINSVILATGGTDYDCEKALKLTHGNRQSAIALIESGRIHRI